jgi:IclR family transcriptional regulator, KDG regulon repressor
MNGVQSLNRMLDILEYVSEKRRPASLSEITGETGLPKSTASRMVSALEERGYISREKESGKIVPGLKILAIAGFIINSLDIVKAAGPFLRELSEKTGETVHLLASEKEFAVYIDKIEYPNTIKLDSQIGKRIPMHCTAAGKALLACRSEKEIKSYLEKAPLEKFTKNTITDPALLLEEIEKIKKKGYSVDNVEYEENVRCVGAAVMDHSGAALAAISVSGPTIRIRQKDLPFFAGAVTETSKNLSKSLGWTEQPA